jgi:glycosyltransferase involved in cell wall biosynthesis
MRRSPPKLRVVLYAGVVFQHDAVSNCLLRKLRLFQRLRDGGYPIDVTAFTQATDCDDPDLRVVPHVGALIRQPKFSDADVHVFDFGMWYQLFNALFVIERPSVVFDHNTTPPDLVDDPVVKLACEKANRERHNLHLASRIAAISEYTRGQLIEMGLDPAKIDVIHLPPNNAPVHARDFLDRARGSVVHLLYVGRFVKAKGIEDLLNAMERIWAADPNVHLIIAGSIRFAQPDVLSSVGRAVAVHGPQGQLSLVTDADDVTLSNLYADCDAFVMPSYHEGYCVPIVEALHSGCFVIGSDAGNVPNVMGGLGSTFPVGDSEAIAVRISTFVARVRRSRMSDEPLIMPTSRGDMTLGEWRVAVDDHLRGYSVINFESKFLRLIDEMVEAEGRSGRGLLTHALQSTEAVLPSAS